MHRLSRCILLAHEDKTFRGAIVASMSIPWGETKGDDELGGYHLVWPRDLVQSAIGLLASGQTETARARAHLAGLFAGTGRRVAAKLAGSTAKRYWTGLAARRSGRADPARVASARKRMRSGFSIRGR